DFFNFKAKYTAGESEEITPARIAQNEANAIRTITQNIYAKLQLSGLARADYIINEEGIWFIEVNTVPGLSSASIVPKMARAAGLSLTEFFSRLIEEAINSRESTLNSERNTGPKQGHIV
ncbi:MAG: D-alanine-D-alanine ligase, partial [Limisphaerales bacterium]